MADEANNSSELMTNKTIAFNHYKTTVASLSGEQKAGTAYEDDGCIAASRDPKDGRDMQLVGPGLLRDRTDTIDANAYSSPSRCTSRAASSLGELQRWSSVSPTISKDRTRIPITCLGASIAEGYIASNNAGAYETKFFCFCYDAIAAFKNQARVFWSPSGKPDTRKLVTTANLRKYGLISNNASLEPLEAPSDVSLFFYNAGSVLVYLLVYVDDILVTEMPPDLTNVIRLEQNFMERDVRMQNGSADLVVGVVNANFYAVFWIDADFEMEKNVQICMRFGGAENNATIGILLQILNNTFNLGTQKFKNVRTKGEGYLPLHDAATMAKGEFVLLAKTKAGKPLAFKSAGRNRLGFWRGLIYDWIPLQEEYVPHNESNTGDIENAVKCSDEFKESKYFVPIRQIIYASFGALRQMIWHVFMLLVPDIKNIRDIKLTHTQTLTIVRILCHNDVTWNGKEAVATFSSPFAEATKLGICEIVNEILNAYFYTYCYKDNDYGVLHLAISHHQEKIFKIIKERKIFKLSTWKAVNKGGKRDNLLHLAGKLAASSQVSGAALQMQREIQWFKAVESYVHPSLQEQQNKKKKTPREVFTEEHKQLVKEGENWMKGTAKSCSVVAALIITVVFTTAFTVPGDNNNDGIPNFLHDTAFIVFVTSDALALFSSTASVVMFLAILTSRYSEDDFLVSLPTKLIIGLITLFFSIASMMVAFGATIYTFVSHSWNWTVIPISVLGCLPVTLFAMLQFPLLVEIFFSTYRPSI
ncbi:uncharacterized protein LOC116145884 [Pistacia vera]|uniref:uncharacterized protein LOC116145884 n=1 Tax=Pistacia vera TaxID=55513 RepID=UPI001263CB89|nr:uncharacterized protein LOC116145884 [Pistacia vera]